MKTEHQKTIAAIRSDRTKTRSRYDEIIALRMLLMDVMDDLPPDLRARVEKRAKKWGRKGDCV